MTQDEIIEIARFAGGCDITSNGWASWVGTQSTEFLERFANLVAAKALAQRIWVGLTGEEAMDVTRKEGHELLDFIYEYGTGSEGVEERIVAICKAIEAKIKDKNNG